MGKQCMNIITSQDIPIELVKIFSSWILELFVLCNLYTHTNMMMIKYYFYEFCKNYLLNFFFFGKICIFFPIKIDVLVQTDHLNSFTYTPTCMSDLHIRQHSIHPKDYFHFLFRHISNDLLFPHQL